MSEHFERHSEEKKKIIKGVGKTILEKKCSKRKFWYSSFFHNLNKNDKNVDEKI